jgi:uncharacterized protein (DUF927 family)
MTAPVLDWVRSWIEHGFRPVPLEPRCKKPVHNDWPNLDFGGDPPRYFRSDSNIGVVDGEPYGNVDIDLDCPEAIQIWPEFAPPTNARFGRPSKPNSHHIYRADPPMRTVKFEDTIEDGGKAKRITLIEVRGLKKDGGVGEQTMCPPSIHPSGERVRFEQGGDGEPANIDSNALGRAARWCAAAALLVRHFPGEGGGRHDAFLAVSGLLQHAGWSEEEAFRFVRGMYRGLWELQADFAAARTEVETTYANARNGNPITGYARLSELIAAKVLRKALKWLDIPIKRTASTTNSEGRAANFAVTSKGVFFDSGTGTPQLVCSPPLEVLATASTYLGNDWSRVLRWQDVRGNSHVQIMPMEYVGESSAYRQELKRQGLLVPEKVRGRDLLANYIMFSVPQSHVRLASRPGWEENGKIYVLPDGAICANSSGSDEVLYHASGPGEHFYRTNGTHDEWNLHVSTKAIGNSRLLFAMSTSFAGPLLALTDTENGGFHFTGLTSLGKTTMQIAAGSVYGGGGIRGFVRTWHATANGLEAICQLHNDGCLMLDEIKQIDPKIAENVVYMICNAMGKNRMTRQITARTSLSWRLLFLSSGELGLAEHVQTAGPKLANIKGGANIRLINIPADAGKGMGAFEQIHDASDAASFAKALASNSKRYYGTAIRAFLRQLVDDLDGALEFVRCVMEQLTSGRSELTGAAPEVFRALVRFALVAAAGELATKFGVTGWNEGDARWAANVCFQAWLKERGGSGSSDLDAGIRQVQGYLERHGLSDFQPLKRHYSQRGDRYEQRIHRRAGFWTEDSNGAREFLVLPQFFRNELCAGFDYRELAGEMKKRGYLRSGRDKRHPYMRQVRTPDGPKQIRVYWLRSTIWSRPDSKKTGQP